MTMAPCPVVFLVRIVAVVKVHVVPVRLVFPLVVVNRLVIPPRDSRGSRGRRRARGPRNRSSATQKQMSLPTKVKQSA